MDVYAVTHTGRVREQNQDYILISGSTPPLYAILADGMGGHNGGETASRMAVELADAALRSVSLPEYPDEQLIEMIDGVSREIFLAASEDEELWNMGTTLVVALVADGLARIANVGDSRAYLYGNGELRQITKDHSYVQTLIDKGKLTPEQAASHPLKNVITRVVGTLSVYADIFRRELPRGTALLLCSDGLTRHVADDEAAAVLRSESSARAAAERLLALALERGGRDNISIILIRNDAEDAE